VAGQLRWVRKKIKTIEYLKNQNCSKAWYDGNISDKIFCCILLSQDFAFSITALHKIQTENIRTNYFEVALQTKMNSTKFESFQL